MVYLDYAANTPVDETVLQTFCDVSTAYIANPNAAHPLGRAAKARLDQSTEQIAGLLGVQESEIIYTSGASESNNLAIKGISGAYKKQGKHIITTYLEHSSVSGAATALQNNGFEVDFVDILENGQVDLSHLKELLRDDTILVSICWVDSELGIKQPIGQIGELLSHYPHCFFHVDATQAVGKIPVSFADVDLMTFAPHKFYGLNGCGVLLKRENVLLEPLIHGGISTTAFRSGTPVPAFAAATEKALALALPNLQARYKAVERLNQKLRQAFREYPRIKINSTDQAVPFILNISLKGAHTAELQEELGEQEIYVSTKSACCPPNTVSRSVYALTKDRKLALSTLRISLSHLTTMEEIDTFLSCFDRCYQKLGK
jgi:cysteine desulfurase